MHWTEEAKEARKKYIGGSDAAGILGLSRYSSPLSVWAIKTGEVKPKDIDDVVAVKLGNKLEQTVSEFFTEETGKKLVRVNKTLTHPKYDFLKANIDRKVVGENAGFEAKTAGPFKTKEWKDDEIPVEYLIQCIHYLAVTGWDAWYIAVLIGNQRFLWKKIDRSEGVINNLVKKELEFWNDFVLPKVMPIQITADDSDILYELFPQATPETQVELGDDIQKLCEIRDSSFADMKILERQIEEYNNTIKSKLKENEMGITKTYKITWRNQLERRIDTKLFKEEQPEMYNRYAPERSKRVLRVKVQK